MVNIVISCLSGNHVFDRNVDKQKNKTIKYSMHLSYTI